MVLNRRAIKANARQFLTNGQWVHLFLAGIIIEAVNYINFGTSLYVQLRNTFNAIYQTQFINVSWNMMSLIALLLLPLEVSIAGYYLGCLRGRAPGLGSVYEEAAAHYSHYFGTMLLRRIYTVLWTMLFIIPGIVKSLSYSMAALIQHDNPTLTASQVLNLSQRITKGYKGSLFLMELSFLGWYLLGAVTFGIAYLYVHPYLYTTQAMYYELLRQNALDRGIASPWEFGMVPNNAFSPMAMRKISRPIGGKRTRAGMQTMAGIKTITASVGTTRLSIPRVHGKMMRIFGIQTGDPANENRKLRSGFQRGNPLLSITHQKS